MATRHKLGTSSPFLALFPPRLGRSRSRSVRRAHLLCMETNSETFEPVLSLSELAARLRVSGQTIYDLLQSELDEVI